MTVASKALGIIGAVADGVWRIIDWATKPAAPIPRAPRGLKEKAHAEAERRKRAKP